MEVKICMNLLRMRGVEWQRKYDFTVKFDSVEVWLHHANPILSSYHAIIWRSKFRGWIDWIQVNVGRWARDKCWKLHNWRKLLTETSLKSMTYLLSTAFKRQLLNSTLNTGEVLTVQIKVVTKFFKFQMINFKSLRPVQTPKQQTSLEHSIPRGRKDSPRKFHFLELLRALKHFPRNLAQLFYLIPPLAG